MKLSTYQLHTNLVFNSDNCLRTHGRPLLYTYIAIHMTTNQKHPSNPWTSSITSKHVVSSEVHQGWWCEVFQASGSMLGCDPWISLVCFLKFIPHVTILVESRSRMNSLLIECRLQSYYSFLIFWTPSDCSKVSPWFFSTLFSHVFLGSGLPGCGCWAFSLRLHVWF